MPEVKPKALTQVDMYQLLSVKSWVFAIWLVLTGFALYFRPLLPIDETRYAAVAWEMWLREDFLVPHLNGEVYSHKPPLLFWFMHFTWLLAGVNDWSLRLISPLFGLGVVYLSASMSRLAWPERKEVEAMVPFMLMGSFFWIFFSTLTMFDMLLTFFVTLGLYCLLKLSKDGLTLPLWLLLGLAIAGGVMSKGPVVLLHLLPAALLAPWWRDESQSGLNWLHWYGGLLFSVLLGAGIALCWAIPAGISGGDAYRQAIFFGQTQGRLVKSFAHDLPWWWYVQFLPVILLPWLLIQPVWAGLKTLNGWDSGLRFCAAWGTPVFIAFSLISGKRAHYLLPLVPVMIMVLARGLAVVDQSAYDWRRTSRGFLALMMLLGIVLALAPLLNELIYRSDELAILSPLWGVFLLLVVACLWLLDAKNAQESVFKVSIVSVIALLVLSSAFFSVREDRYDTGETSKKIAEIFAQNKEVAYLVDIYHGEYQFGGRLTGSVKAISSIEQLHEWRTRHSDAYVMIRYQKDADLPNPFPYYHHRYKGSNVALLPIDALLTNSELKKILIY